ncbi:MAG: hypothetical protein CR997_06555 [Acidobacteria bacterium]|nr:MAG: hypothetical protein CR997_06555 [Acidobacteriota bacterium]
MDSSSISCILLAAGGSRRMGGEQKVLLSLNQMSFLHRIVTQILACKPGQIVVVTGHHSKRIEAHLQAMPAWYERSNATEKVIVFNRVWESGMASSIQAGMGALSRKCKGVMIALGDLPLIRNETYGRICNHFLRHPAKIIRPVCDQKPGHPVIFPRARFSELSQLKGDKGGSQLFSEHDHELLLVPVNDPGIYRDIDSWQDWQLLSVDGLQS